MRWIFNTILIVVVLFIIVLFSYDNVNYDYSPLTGFAVIAPNLPGVCDDSSLEAFWDNIYQAKYKKSNLNLLIKKDTASVINGNCFNFAIYNISGDNLLVYIVNEYTPDPSYSELFIGGISNFSSSLNLPSNTQQLISALKTLPNDVNNIKKI